MHSSKGNDRKTEDSNWFLLCKIQQGYVTLEVKCPFKPSWIVSLLSLACAALGFRSWLQ